MIQKVVKWITGNRYLMGFLEFLVGNPVADMLLTIIIKVGAWVANIVFSIMRKVFRVSLESIVISLMKLPFVREITVNVMVMIKSIVKGIEPEVIYVFREVMRIRGVKEVILPLAMSTGSIIETLTAPDVIAKLGGKEKA